MANVISLHTTNYPTLTQVLVNTPTGLFDFKAQQASGHVNVADSGTKAVILSVKGPTGLPVLLET